MKVREKTTSKSSDGEQSAITLKIGVMGAATGVIQRDHVDKAHALGRAIAQSGCVLITGACPGLPLAAACGAKQEGGLVVGISPALSLDEHLRKYRSPDQFHDVLIFTGSGLMGREVVNIRSSDIVIIIGGRSGTLGELAIAYDEGKLIGVLTGTGGISDMVADILSACAKKTGARVVYNPEPDQLVKKLLHVYRTCHFLRPSCFCEDEQAAEHCDQTVPIRTDPVCGMAITAGAAAAKRKVKGQMWYFCSQACANTFDNAPTEYLLSASKGHEKLMGQRAGDARRNRLCAPRPKSMR
jgi:uncharacterized protein (TIGR00725 family)